MLNDDVIDFLRFHIPLFAILALIVVAWTHFYVIPASEWNNTIMNCQLDIDDLSYEGYEYCVELNTPNSNLMTR